jgi:hypothetical protein
MFAVIVLGIGFIMIAAIFPVAISQTQLSADDTAGVSTGYAGFALMQKLIAQEGLNAANPPPLGSHLNYVLDGTVHPIEDAAVAIPGPMNRWDLLRGNFISSSDPRFGWIPIGYKGTDLAAGTPNTIHRFAEFYVMAVRARNRSNLDVNDFLPKAPMTIAPLHSKPIAGVRIEDASVSSKGVDMVTFTPGATNNDAAEIGGAYILVANDNATGLMNGQYYKIGVQLDTDMWQLDPAKDFQINPGPDRILNTGDDIKAIASASVLAVGRGYDDYNAPTKWDGLSQDVFMLPPVTIQLPIPK